VTNVLIIGAGGVGAAVAHKCAQHNDILGAITIASRTKSKCDDIIASIRRRNSLKEPAGELYPRQVDAGDKDAVSQLIRDTQSTMVINVASPYCNLAIIDACLATRTDYIDTACHEVEGVINAPPPWYGNYEWKLRDEFARRGVTGILGAGFDPGAVNVFCAYVHKHLIETIETIDIMDVNAGNHHRYFATNFDAVTNLREIMEDSVYWEDGQWKSVPCHTRSRTYPFPEVGTHRVYSMGHDEVHSLAAHISAQRIEFWMAFDDHYLTCFNVLRDIGMLSQEPVQVGEVDIMPIEVVKAVLPDPMSLASEYSGKTCIGCQIKGTHKGRQKEVFIYNICDHARCYEELGTQAISYTTAVPAVTTAILIAQGVWKVRSLVNMEELDPDPFMELMPTLGLSWRVRNGTAPNPPTVSSDTQHGTCK